VGNSGTIVFVGITPKQFEQMKNRLSRPKAAAVSVFDSHLRMPASRHQIILGIDPSLRGTGYGVVRLARPHPQALAFGTIHCPAGWERSRCLVRIAQTLREVLQRYQPTVCVLEGLFFAQNLQTALLMGEARQPGNGGGSGFGDLRNRSEEGEASHCRVRRGPKTGRGQNGAADVASFRATGGGRG
jgi:hypothetical protein